MTKHTEIMKSSGNLFTRLPIYARYVKIINDICNAYSAYTLIMKTSHTKRDIRKWIKFLKTTRCLDIIDHVYAISNTL